MQIDRLHNPSAKPSGRVLRRLLKLLRPYILPAMLVLTLIVINTVLRVAAQDVLRVTVNGLPRPGETVTQPMGEQMLPFLLIMAVAYIATGGARFLVLNRVRVARTEFGMRILWDLRGKIFDRLQLLSFGFFDGNPTGQLINRATGDVNTIRRFFMMALFSIVTLALTLAIYAVRMATINWQLTLLCLAPVPISIALLVRFGRVIRKKFRAARESSDEMANALQENVAGVQVVKAFARESAEMEKYRGRTSGVYKRVLQIVRTFRNNMPLINGISHISIVIMLWMGAALVMDGKMELGDLLFFSMALGTVIQQMFMVIGITNITQEAATSAERVFEILDAVPDVADAAGAPDLPEGAGRVEFENVTFGYDPEKPVLREINLRIEPGQIVALVGPTGSGKSSLTHLIPRFYDPSAGRVLIDGADVREVRLRSLRDAVGLVFQDTFLFATTLAENISFGVPGAGEEQVHAAARIARADEFIEQLEDGYETIIGERGVTLSGGQRQRVAIARAVLKNPRILILDDATASVDSATERHIQEALDEVMRGRTTFVIAHRMSTVRRADLVVVIENGRISQTGTHAELFATDGHYRQMCLLQLQDALGKDNE